ncbi:endolytic transglycosylase MltG [Polynucleobacter sp. 30F-ANTBAC]|uniref:endolytic transglycosylase MltG n=1 Tax=Polynucleobacter sp. 30F-ANTBAC TaxID=2689095 RepID=UPI0021041C68|nr:endolytic transglycosylase MltG [Polynucleobacter sp. 30F-ANTBAC]
MKRILPRHFFKVFTLLVFLTALTLAYWSFGVSAIPSGATPVTSEGQYRIKIKPGSNVNSVARQLMAQGVDTNTLKVQLVARALLQGSKLKAGVYDLAPGASLGSILLKMGRGESVRLSITLVEGATFKQFKSAIDAQPELKKEAQKWSDKQILVAIQAKESHPEGLFFPDTYLYEPGDTDLVIYQRAYQAMNKKLVEHWAKRSSDSPVKSPYDLLKLASIIEKETGHHEDRALVSAVFNNRLKIGMKLQTDPTVIYGLGDRFDGDLRKRDLLKDGPYNTYTRYGLPPTPIAMPGKESLAAAIQPAQSSAVYFVAKGDGRSIFSETLVEHNRAVRQYQLRK